MKKALILFSFLLITCIASAQVKSVRLMLKSDFYTNSFDVYLKVMEGNATTIQQRGQFNSQISIVTAKEITDMSIVSYMPLRGNQNYNSTTPMIWTDDLIAAAPSVDPLHNYFSILPTISPSSFYNDLKEGDEVKLFTIKLNKAVCYTELRLFQNGVDHNNINGADFTNSYSIGSPAELFQGSDDARKSLMSESYLCAGGEHILSYNKSDSWTISNENVVKIEGNVIKALQPGTAQIQANSANGQCQSPVFDISVTEGPGIAVSEGKLVASVAEGQFKWYACGSNEVIKESVEPWFEPATSGEYYAEIKTEDCHVKTPCVNYLLSSTDGDFDPKQAMIYPSVSSGRFTCNLLPGRYEAEVFDAEGNKVLSFSHHQQSKEQTLDINNLSSGLYMVKINGAVSFSQKVIISRQ